MSEVESNQVQAFSSRCNINVHPCREVQIANLTAWRFLSKRDVPYSKRYSSRVRQRSREPIGRMKDGCNVPTPKHQKMSSKVAVPISIIIESKPNCDMAAMALEKMQLITPNAIASFARLQKLVPLKAESGLPQSNSPDLKTRTAEPIATRLVTANANQ